MEYRKVGSIQHVSLLCFGTLTMGPLQCNFTTQIGAELLAEGFLQGINCLDTAEYYQNYPPIREALRQNPGIKIFTKCHAYDRTGAEESMEKALRETGAKKLGVMMLHEQESFWTLQGHQAALEVFQEYKEKGWLEAVGVSTHFVQCAEAAAKHPYIDVIEAICNEKGVGIVDGTEAQMEEALERAHQAGKGIIGIKALAGGHFSADSARALEYVMQKPFLDCIAIGMQSKEEILFNAKFFNGEWDASLYRQVSGKKRALHIADWCIGCGACQARCQSGAIKVEGKKAKVNLNTCVLCGYCVGACPEFCIKVY